MYLVSVIIPVYNISSLLEQCVKSVLKQSYSNIEILLVDDGSTDCSAELCDRLACKDNRINVFHKKNGGLSDARNYGLIRAMGDYIFFLDGDDWIPEDAIESLLNVAVSENADIVQGGYYYAYEDFMMTLKDAPVQKAFQKEEAMRELLCDGLIKNFAWGNIIKKELALNVQFRKNKFFEDVYWKYRIIDLCSGYVYISKPVYYYRQRNNSISSSFTLKNIDLLEGTRERLEFLRTNYPLVFSLALREYWYVAFLFMKLADRCGKDIRKAYKDYFKRLNDEYRNELPAAMNENLKSRIQFLISGKLHVLYPVYSFVEKIISRLQPDKYVKISD